MVKKSIKNKSPLEEKQEPLEDEQKKVADDHPEPHKLSGNFKEDFYALCQEAKYSYTPRVLPRPQPPTADERIKSSKFTRKDLKSASSYRPDSVSRSPETYSPPKTFLIKEGSDYFSPSIHVESIDRERLDQITEIYIKSWLVEDKMMEILCRCFSVQENLIVLSLWRVGLTPQTLERLSRLVSSSSIKTLMLDNNPLECEEWHMLLRGSSPIRHLSLRHNLITSDGCQKLGHVLSAFCDQSTSRLISLNLSGNKVTDEGAEHLASGLKYNSTLLFLDLSNNCIGNYGAKKLAQAVSKFPMSHVEVVMRRKYIWNKLCRPEKKKDEVLRDEKPTSRPSKTDDLKSVKEGEKTKKSKKKDAAESKDGKKNKVPDSSRPDKSNQRGEEQPSSSPPPIGESSGGLENLNHTEYKEGVLYMKGNFRLISLNLSYNPIDEKGLIYFVDALKFQDEEVKESKEQNLKGLRRLQFQGITACPDNIEQIESIMKLRNAALDNDDNLDSEAPIQKI